MREWRRDITASIWRVSRFAQARAAASTWMPTRARLNWGASDTSSPATPLTFAWISPERPDGYAVRMRFTARVAGPCMRCLTDADVPVEIDAREIDQPGTEDEELRSPYIEGDELALGSWAHDALALALPLQLLCRPDCAGLCPVCGVLAERRRSGRAPARVRPGPASGTKLRELKSTSSDRRWLRGDQGYPDHLQAPGERVNANLFTCSDV